MSKNVFLVCAVAAWMLCAGPALAADTVIWSEDFDSYTVGSPPPAPWADWTSGTGPAPTTVVAGGVTGNAMNMLPNYVEAIHWLGNPFDVNNRAVTITWYVKGDPGNSGGPASSYGPSFLDTIWGSMEGSYGTPQTAGQYANNLGSLWVNGDWSDPNTCLTPFSYGGTLYSNAVLQDGQTWNKFELTAVARNVSPNAILGEASLTVSYADPVNPSVIHTTTTATNMFNLAGIGLTGFDAWATTQNDAKSWYVDDISVVQNGELAAPPEGLPTPKSAYPGFHGLQGGGITSDGHRYLYVTGGSEADGGMWRYDTQTNTWTQMASRPTTTGSHGAQDEAHGIGIASVGAKGTITVFAGASFPNGCNAYDYDIATDTWAPVVVGLDSSPATYDPVKGAEAAGALTFGGIVPSQSGVVVYDNTTRTFVHGQTEMWINPPGGWKTGYDMAYAGGEYIYLLNHNDPNTGMGMLERWDLAADAWADPNSPLAEMPAAFPEAGQSALTYVPDGVDSLYIIHQVFGNAGLYEVAVPGGKLIAALNGSNDLYCYDIAGNTWTVLPDALPFNFGEGDDISAGVPEPATLSVLAMGALAILRRRRR